MIIRGTPKELNKYIVVDSDTSEMLHKNGFIPKYIDGNDIYYLKDKEILEFMERSVGWQKKILNNFP